ncbi:MAG: hypothetical protein ACOY4K_09910 [Pseudomonadota bacterium]
MRRIALFIASAMAAGSTAFAAQAGPLGPVSSVNVIIGGDLADKADRYGQRELDFLAADLQASVEKALARSGDLAMDGGRLDLVIEDALPNRPTLEQMRDNPSLSYESFGIGGAAVSGVLTTADGRQIPVGYRWYETDIRWTIAASTWHDATLTFDRFASRLARGETLARR